MNSPTATTLPSLSHVLSCPVIWKTERKKEFTECYIQWFISGLVYGKDWKRVSRFALQVCKSLFRLSTHHTYFRKPRILIIVYTYFIKSNISLFTVQVTSDSSVSISSWASSVKPDVDRKTFLTSRNTKNSFIPAFTTLTWIIFVQWVSLKHGSLFRLRLTQTAYNKTQNIQ